MKSLWSRDFELTRRMKTLSLMMALSSDVFSVDLQAIAFQALPRSEWGCNFVDFRPVADRVAIEREFVKEVGQRLREAGAEVSPEAARQIRRLISEGASTLDRTNAQAAEIAKAEADLLRLVDAVLQAAASEPSESFPGLEVPASPRVDEGIVVRVVRTICPLYPFC